MKNFRSIRLALGILMVFACVLALAPVCKAEKITPDQQLKALRANLKSAQSELRRLNEEGSSADQERAQALMQRVSQIRERIAELEEKPQ